MQACVLLCRAQQGVSVVRLHSSGGVVSRTPAVRKQARMQRVREYFYGVRGDLSPHSQTVRLDDLRIYRIGGGPRAPTSALPIGAHMLSYLQTCRRTPTK